MAALVRIALGLFDAVLLAVCLRLGGALAALLGLGPDGGWPLPGTPGFALFAFSVVLWTVLAWQEGLHRLEPEDGWDVYFAALRAVLKGAAALAGLLFLLRLGPEAPRAGAAFGLLLVLLLLPLLRALLRKPTAARLGARRTLLVGDAEGLEAFWRAKSARRTAETFGLRGQLQIGGEDPLPPVAAQGAPLLGSLEALDETLAASGANQLLVAAGTLRRRQLLDLLQRTLGRTPRLYLLPDIASLDIAEVELGRVGGQPVLLFNQGLRSPFNAALKRGLDIVGALVGLLLLGLPMLLIALAVRLGSPGPVIYRHRRFGLQRRYIFLNKFRTMVVDADAVLERLLAEDPEARAEWEAQCKLRDDPRVTAVGRVLRRFSLDELPQIVNVLLGQMSLVGPRPISEVEYDKYTVWQDNRMSVRPGLTGLWQVSGRGDLDFDDRIKLDMYYIRNWTIWLDLRIILKTLTVLVSKEGAY
jgi:exopolysaccharide biosynthesis polyprenyl glycosylphosphotransferase